MNPTIFELILAIKQKCQSNEDDIRRCLGLSQAQFNALMVLDSRDEILGGQLAARMGLSPSRGSRVLTQLVNAGLAQVEFGSDDRRTIAVGLTPKGKRMRKRIVEQMEVCEERLCRKLRPAEKQQVQSVLEQLASVL